MSLSEVTCPNSLPPRVVPHRVCSPAVRDTTVPRGSLLRTSFLSLLIPWPHPKPILHSQPTDLLYLQAGLLASLAVSVPPWPLTGSGIDEALGFGQQLGVWRGSVLAPGLSPQGRGFCGQRGWAPGLAGCGWRVRARALCSERDEVCSGGEGRRGPQGGGGGGGGCGRGRWGRENRGLRGCGHWGGR